MSVLTSEIVKYRAEKSRVDISGLYGRKKNKRKKSSEYIVLSKDVDIYPKT